MIDWSTVRHFTEAEFRCPCGACPGSAHPPMDRGLILALDNVREEYGRPMRVTSGYRCPSHNAAVGGASDSAHLTGQAADVRCATGPARRALLLVALSRIERIELAARHCHFEDRPQRQPAVWLGTSR